MNSKLIVNLKKEQSSSVNIGLFADSCYVNLCIGHRMRQK